MSGDKLSKNGLDKPKNEKETNIMALVTKGVVCLENGVENHMNKEARQTFNYEHWDGGNERSNTFLAPRNCHVETTEDAKLSEDTQMKKLEHVEKSDVEQAIGKSTFSFLVCIELEVSLLYCIS